MDSKTKAALDKAGPETRQLFISNDTSLDKGDVSRIVRKLKECKRIEHLVLVGCDFSTDPDGLIIQALAEHPSLLTIDLSNNKNSNYRQIDNLLKKSTQLQSIVLVGISGGGITERKTAWRAIFDSLKTADSLTKLKISSAPFNNGQSTEFNYTEIREFFNQQLHNLLDLEFEYGQDEDEIIGTRLRNNRNVAEGLLSSLRKGDIKTSMDVENLNLRLPAVIAVAQETAHRGIIIGQLKKLDAQLQRDLGAFLNLEPYLTEAEKSAQFTPFTEIEAPKTAANLPTIQDIGRDLTPITRDALREQIKGGADNLLQIVELGKEAIGLVGNIALASLQSTASLKSMESPTRSMADFIQKFSEAKQIIADLTDPQKNSSAPPHTVKQTGIYVLKRLLFRRDVDGFHEDTRKWKESGNFSTTENLLLEKMSLSPLAIFIGRSAALRLKNLLSENGATQLHSLADAGVLAHEAGKILQDMIPSLSTMEERLGEQLSATQQIVTAYKRASDQICLAQEVGQEVLAEWRQNTKQTVEIFSPGAQVQDGEPLHVQSLASRLDFLEEMRLQIDGHISRHILHAAVDQKQQQGIAMLRGQNLPLIAEQTATFMRQVEEMQRAGVINNLANATRIATSTEGDTTVNAALQTMQAIENLAGSTRDALASMGKTASQVNEQIGKRSITDARLAGPGLN